MPGRSRRTSTLSPENALQGGSAQAVGHDNSFMQAYMDLYTAPGKALNDDEDAGFLASVASDMRAVAGATNAIGQAAKVGSMPGVGPLATVFGAMNASRAMDDIREDGLDLDNGFRWTNAMIGALGPVLPGAGPLLAASWGAGTMAGKHLDAASERAATHVAGPDGDTRGLSDRLADRGDRVNQFLDGALSNVMSEENADLAGDVLGGASTVGQVFTPAFHYDLVDSFTGGGLSG